MNASNPVAHHEVEIHGTVVDMLVGGAASPRPMVAFAHPTDRFDESSVDLLAGLVGGMIVVGLACVVTATRAAARGDLARALQSE